MPESPDRRDVPVVAREHHYVPQSYLKRWSSDGRRVWASRTLVPRADSPIWERPAIRRLAVRRDLYTTLSQGQVSDAVERWFAEDVEGPAQVVMERLAAGESVRDADRLPLSRFVAALAVRGPASYERHTRAVSSHMERVLPTILDRVVAEAQARGAAGLPLEEPPEDADPLPGFSAVVSPHPTSDDPDAAVIEVDIAVGRALWLRQIRYLVDEVSLLMLHHDWHVVPAPSGTQWLTSDDPVVRLRYRSPTDFALDGAWGDPGTEIIVPVSPSALLYTCVGQQHPPRLRFTSEQATILQRCIAAHAHRWIIAETNAIDVSAMRPRTVDLAQFRAEQLAWEGWSEAQAAIERE